MLGRVARRLFSTGGWKQPGSNFNNGKYQKYWAKEDSTPLSSDIDVRNYNITISREDWDIFFFCFHPQVVKKGPTSYEIKKNSSVMAISFVEKIKGLHSEETQWQNRKSITFKFIDLGKLLHVEPGKGNTARISVPKRDSELASSSKDLSLVDDTQAKQINFELTNVSKRLQGNTLLETEIDRPIKLSLSYQEYRLFYELVRSSLFELSGWKFTMELQRAQFIDKIKMGRVDEDLDNMTINRKRTQQTFPGRKPLTDE